ncbi:MAG: glycosyltransferase family 39 protein [Bacteroidia bacterium]
MDIISHKHPYSNNHLLNSLFIKYSEKLFGTSEFSLRLPNLLMLLVFFTYLFLLLKKCNRILGVSIFILICTNVYLIDFFGLARGYGISIGFMVMSLYHFIESFKGNEKKHLIFFNLSAMFTILSHFTTLDFYAAALFIFNLIKFIETKFILNQKFNFLKTNKINIILFLCILIVLYEPVRRVTTFNVFDSGGKLGFMADTMTSLVNITFINIPLGPFEVLFFQVIFLLLLFIPLLIILRNTIRRSEDFYKNFKPLIISNLLLLIILSETILQHYLFKTDYLGGRFSLFLYPLFILNVTFLLDYIIKIRYLNILVSVVVLLAGLSIFNFYNHINLYACGEWTYDMETKNAVKELVADQKNTDTKHPIKLGVNWLFEPTANFYRQIWHINNLLPIDRQTIKSNCDYYYIFKSDLDTMNLNLKNYKIIFSSERTNSILIKNNK